MHEQRRAACVERVERVERVGAGGLTGASGVACTILTGALRQVVVLAVARPGGTSTAIFGL